MTTAKLILEDGTIFSGYGLKGAKNIAGEVVFNTAMTGYPESLTDPSYSGQILCLTYPLIGNYGVPPKNESKYGLSLYMENNHISITGLVISDYSSEYSHWNAVESLEDWLKKEEIPAIYGIDTRSLTKLLREKGSMKGKMIFDDSKEIDFFDPNTINQVEVVSCKEVIYYGNEINNKNILLVDCGVKHNIIRNLLSRNFNVIRVPWDYNFNNNDLKYDGLFLTNGPGNPDTCSKTIENIRKALNNDKPICGICMGNQLLAKAGGATIYKLKYGHRSHNQPVQMVGTNKCYITSQNHGFAVDSNTIKNDWEPLFINMNDGTNEGIKHKNKPFFSVQFHPEATGGATDTEFIFDMFAENIYK